MRKPVLMVLLALALGSLETLANDKIVFFQPEQIHLSLGGNQYRNEVN